MPDVSLLFVSPTNPSLILVYGMLKQAGAALLGGVVILAQAANFNNFFGVSIGGTIVIFIGYAISLASAEALAVAIYSFTGGSIRLKLAVKIAVVSLLLPLVIIAGYGVVTVGLWPGLIGAATCFYARLIPIAGWTSAGVSAFMQGNILFGLLCYSGNMALILGAVALMRRHGSDYYEDVLAGTAAAETIKAARTSGDATGVSTLRRKVKVRGTGLFGEGGAAVMSRQMRESMRLNPLKLLDSYSLAIIALAGVMAYSNRSVGSSIALVITFFITVYMQMIFMTATGPLRELTGHYIFLIPERPLVKLLWNNGASALKALLESVLVYLAAGVILGLSPATIAAAAMANFCFCLMLLALNVWGLRFFGSSINRGIMLVVYLLIAIFSALPGIIWATVTAFSQPGLMADMVVPALLLSLWELVMAMLYTYWSRNVLHNIDMIKIEIKK